MKRVLKCRNCGDVISTPVTIFDVNSTEYDQRKFVDDEHLIKQGFAFLLHELCRKRLKGPPGLLEFTPQYWMAIRDISEKVQLTKDGSRLNGCCGLDGCHGPNRACSCGSHVGTEMIDCWAACLLFPALQQPNCLMRTEP